MACCHLLFTPRTSILLAMSATDTTSDPEFAQSAQFRRTAVTFPGSSRSLTIRLHSIPHQRSTSLEYSTIITDPCNLLGFPITPDHPYHRYHSFLQLAGFWLFRWSAPPRARAAMARSACTNRALQIIYRSAPHRECTGPWGDSATFGSFMSFERCPCGVRFLLAAHPGSCASIPTVQRWQSQVRELRAACGPRIAATDTQGGKRN